MHVSLSMAESLERAGFPQETRLCWVYRRGEWRVTARNDLAYNEPAIAAPDEIEILMRLPMLIQKDGKLRYFDLLNFMADTLGEAYLNHPRQ